MTDRLKGGDAINVRGVKKTTCAICKFLVGYFQHIGAFCGQLVLQAVRLMSHVFLSYLLIIFYEDVFRAVKTKCICGKIITGRLVCKSQPKSVK